MPAAIVARADTTFTVQVEIPHASSMLDLEEAIQQGLNEAGVLANTEALRQFDADGSPIQVGDTKLAGRGKLKKEYQAPYGVATVERHVYRSGRGGKTCCPLDREARIVVISTPKFAKMVSHEYAEFGSARVIKDLAENHGRVVARRFVQDVADAVATVALARQEDWEYALPELQETPPTVAIGMDGTCLLICEGGWRETMVGTIGLYEAEGDRQHTIYPAATPEYGKAKFLGRMGREIGRGKAVYPGARYVGLADGAKGNWEFLGRHTETQVIDSWHAAGSLSDAGDAPFARGPDAKRAWLEASCRRLEHEPGAARQLIKGFRRMAAQKGVSADHEGVAAAITYSTNRSKAGRMDYPPLATASVPIGSGATEAACKVLVKRRPGGSGMKWKEPGAAAVLSLRCLTYTTERWGQFWARIDRTGFPAPAWISHHSQVAPVVHDVGRELAERRDADPKTGDALADLNWPSSSATGDGFAPASRARPRRASHDRRLAAAEGRPPDPGLADRLGPRPSTRTAGQFPRPPARGQDRRGPGPLGGLGPGRLDSRDADAEGSRSRAVPHRRLAPGAASPDRALRRGPLQRLRQADGARPTAAASVKPGPRCSWATARRGTGRSGRATSPSTRRSSTSFTCSAICSLRPRPSTTRPRTPGTNTSSGCERPGAGRRSKSSTNSVPGRPSKVRLPKRPPTRPHA
jgi:hypothetical protein